mgnify:CR=1 FL=1
MKNYMHLDISEANEPFAQAGADEVSRHSYIAEIKDMDEWYATVVDFIFMYQGR